MEITENKIRQYLLGSLPPEEMRLFDLQVISDPALEERLVIEEDRLMEDYLDKTLSAQELELFQKNFLISPDRKNQLEHLFLLKSYAQKITIQPEAVGTETATVSGETAVGSNFLQHLKGLFSLNLRPLAVISVLLIAAFLTVIFIYQRNWSDDAQLARLNRQDFSDLAGFKNLSNLNLISGSFRDASAAAPGTLKESDLTGNVLLRLALPPNNYPAGTLFSIKISSEQSPDSSRLSGVPLYSNQSGPEIRLLIPSALLKKGFYKIEAVPENTGEAPFVFLFKVE